MKGADIYMSEKRRDSKGRILRNGKCQRKDDLIRKNPFEFQLVSVIVNDSVIRELLHMIKKGSF